MRRAIKGYVGRVRARPAKDARISKSRVAMSTPVLRSYPLHRFHHVRHILIAHPRIYGQ